jgi:DNA-directed RNA polymerase subunit RPC12/RpoP
MLKCSACKAVLDESAFCFDRQAGKRRNGRAYRCRACNQKRLSALWRRKSGVRSQETASAHSRAMSHHRREYSIWMGMHVRCYYPSNPGFKNYGGKGVAICDRWRNQRSRRSGEQFLAFLADMGPCPSDRHTVDRIDNGKGYEPGNCRWATFTEQQRHRSNNRVLEFRGRSQCLSAWAEEFGVNTSLVADRLGRGWSVEDALSVPARKLNRRRHG